MHDFVPILKCTLKGKTLWYVNSQEFRQLMQSKETVPTRLPSLHAAAAAKSLQSCLTEAHQAPLSLGFSRQGHWNGLPFPSPMHESEKWKWIRSVLSNSQRPHGLQPTRHLCPWDFPGKSTGVGCHWLLHLTSWPRYKFGGPQGHIHTRWLQIRGFPNNHPQIQ